VAPVSEPLSTAVLVSGAGTNLQALLDTVHGHEAEVVAVASSVAGAPALARASARGVPNGVFARSDYSDREARDRALADWLEERGAQLVVGAGYMELLGSSFLARFPGAVINVHPSLLPAFPGLHPQRQALAAGVKFSGCTVHFVRVALDTGPIIAQAVVPVEDGDDEDCLAARILAAEHRLYPLAIRLVAEGLLRIAGERVHVAGGAAPDIVALNPSAALT